MRESKEPATVQIRIDVDLYKAAAIEAHRQRRKVRGQLEKWIEDGMKAGKAAARGEARNG